MYVTVYPPPPPLFSHPPTQLATGQERYSSTLSTSYYKGAHAVILVYNTTEMDSFRDVQDFWMNQVYIQYGRDVCDKMPVVLVGTKSDLLRKKYEDNDEYDSVKKMDAKRMKGSTERLLGPIHCSAKTGRNVDKVFKKVAEELVARDSTGRVRPPITIHKVNSQCRLCS